MKQPLPIGIDNFEKLISEGYYYVDKSLLIRELLDLKGEVNLFTRPRRFGKSLNLSMLRYFFEDTGEEERNRHNRELFSGLKIMKADSRYTSQMSSCPVINLTMKSAKQPTFASAFFKLKDVIAEEFCRHAGILGKNKLSAREERRFRRIADGEADYDELSGSLEFLSRCLYKVQGKKVIILIDKYDVPLESAYFGGYYDQMSDFIRSLFESALKTNEFLNFAVITGCLRISRESIFTGLNHLNIISVLDQNYSEHFGFTEREVLQAMSFYGHEERFPDMKKWYDGYLFGDTNVYNPWSVLKFLYDLNADNGAFPRPYWVNTSSSALIRDAVRRSDQDVRAQMEVLVNGGSIDFPVHEEITYADMNQKGNYFWNFLYFTGYLTRAEKWLEKRQIILRAVIPNEELLSVYENVIMGWLEENIKKQDFYALYQALEDGDAKRMREIIGEQLLAVISFYDSAENFYHGFLAGILSQSKKYLVKSNRESGSGRSDIMIRDPSLRGRAFIIEVKVSGSMNDLEKDAQNAVRQIYEKNYPGELRMEGYQRISCCGIAFYRKDCEVQFSD